MELEMGFSKVETNFGPLYLVIDMAVCVFPIA